MLTIVCRASCCLWCSIKWQGGFCFGFFYFFSSFRIPLWAPSVGRCWAEEQKSLRAGLKMGLEARRIQEVTLLVEKQSCLMEGQKWTGPFFPVGKEATQPYLPGITSASNSDSPESKESLLPQEIHVACPSFSQEQHFHFSEGWIQVPV